MCGIAGLYCPDGVAEFLPALLGAQQVARHRGPDGEGLCLLDSTSGRSLSVPSEALLPQAASFGHADVALGHRRLSILDLSPAGRQPMANRDASVWITYNGEVYNYLELRAELEALGHTFSSRSDTEVLLRAYEEWGPDCLHRCNGMWAFAIVDLPRRRLFAARDRYGVKPFHFHHDGRRLAFASEIKQLLQFPFVPRRANPRAIYDFLVYSGVEYCEETFFEGVGRLLPGHCLSLDLDSGFLQVRPWYQPPCRLDTSLSPARAAARFRELLTDSVRLRLRSDVEVGSCLSGGLDSSSIVCLMNGILRQEGKGHVQQTFTSHFDEPEADELEYARTVIETTGVRAHIVRPRPGEVLEDLERVVFHQEEPFGSTSIFAQWFVFKSVRQEGVVVMLDGQGADEILGGYLGCVEAYLAELRARGQRARMRWERWRHRCLQEGVPWYRGLHLLGRPPSRNGVPLPSSDEWLQPELRARCAPASRYAPTLKLAPFGEVAHFSNLLYQLSFVNNLQTLLHFADRNSMAFSVESRLPFLDYRLVEFLISLPSHLKIRHGYTKRVLREGMAGVLPERIRWRVSKLGFATPESRWLRTVLKPRLAEALASPVLDPYVRRDAARRLVEAVEQGRASDSTPWRLLNLYLWIRGFGLEG
ncbi:MAG TPA: asparagine synthase (glutamine-hydrolyzing) [Candidatus Nitrosotenuis sp.]|jgi:asparagine synthase (glutamine-hydrolysing)|nr:asparagine synthase (glutamine-hydrolyzing) [Candidatus Nitrosotenuis sp.]